MWKIGLWRLNGWSWITFKLFLLLNQWISLISTHVHKVPPPKRTVVELELLSWHYFQTHLDILLIENQATIPDSKAEILLIMIYKDVKGHQGHVYKMPDKSPIQIQTDIPDRKTVFQNVPQPPLATGCNLFWENDLNYYYL